MPELILESSQITGSATLKLPDFYAGAFFRWPAGVRWAYAVGFVIVIAYTIWLDDVDDFESFQESVGALLVGLVCCIASSLAMLALLFSRMSPQQRQIAYEINREKIVQKSGTGSAIVWPWTHVKRCREHRTGFALRVRPIGTIWLYKRAFGPCELQALRALANSALETR